MIIRFRYVNAFLALALLAGQVQYAYVTYFCTEQHSQVGRPTIEKHPTGLLSGSTVCSECHGVIPVHRGTALASTNCIQMTTHSKSIISSFTNFEKVVSHYRTSELFRSRRPVGNNQLSAISYWLSPPTDSPPLPLHITNLNFRI